MNSKALVKQYDQLMPRERYPLLVAARLRGDDIETERLKRTAPTALFRVPDYQGMAETMSDLALLHVMQQLDTTAWLWRLEGWLEAEPVAAAPDAEEAAYRLRQLLVLRLRAYLFVVEAEAWQRFCAELHLEPEALLRDVPGYDTVRQAEGDARMWAFTPEKAAAAARQLWGEGGRVQTVESVLAQLRAGLAWREESGR